MNITEPAVIERSEQPYASIVRSVTMAQMVEVLVPATDQVIQWLAAQGIQPAGAPLWKYNVIDMEHEMEIEVGVPTASLIDGSGEVKSGVLPAGRYASLHHTGHPDELAAATGALLDWAKQQGLSFDISADDRWAARLEIYETDPDDEPDMTKWETTLAFRLAD